MLRIPHIPGFVLSTVNLRGSYESVCCFLKFRESFHAKIFRWVFLEKYSKFSEHIPKNTSDQLLLSIQVYIIAFSVPSITYPERVKKKASSYVTLINIIYALLIKFFCYGLPKHRIMTTVNLLLITTLIKNSPAAGIISIYRFLNKTFIKLPIN